jgi:methylated-DNA-[protein]-cysteine S-methyltransferase
MPPGPSPMGLTILTPLPFVLEVESDGEAIVTARFARPKRPPANIRSSDALLAEAAAQVRAYFKRRLRRFDLPLKFAGTPFSQAVWECVAGLSFGEFVSYADVARAIGRPLAHRGVAMAMGRTPIDLFVPAHRVIGADGRVKGATPGSSRMALVAFERKGRALVSGKVAKA